MIKLTELVLVSFELTLFSETKQLFSPNEKFNERISVQDEQRKLFEVLLFLFFNS